MPREPVVGESTVSPDAEREAQRAQTLADLDALIQIAAQARRDVRSYHSALEKNYDHLAKGGLASDMIGLFDVSAVRSSFSERLNTIERARNRSRRSIWRLQLLEGMTIAEIARLWGFSRQLVSRELSSRDDARDGARDDAHDDDS